MAVPDLDAMLSQLLSPQIQNAASGGDLSGQASSAGGQTDSGAQIAKDSKAQEASQAGLPGFSLGDFVNGILQHIGGTGGKVGGQQDAYSRSILGNATTGVAQGTGAQGAATAMQAATQARTNAGSGGGGGGLGDLATIAQTIGSLFGL